MFEHEQALKGGCLLLQFLVIQRPPAALVRAMLTMVLGMVSLCAWFTVVCWFWLEYFRPMRLLDWIGRDRFLQLIIATGIPSRVLIVYIAVVWLSSWLTMLVLPAVLLKLWEKRQARHHPGKQDHKLKQSESTADGAD
jgi:hypothetical protein